MSRWRPTWSAAMAALASLPVVVATTRALARGWLPMGDNAYFAIRARDVLTEHHPLVGAWSSGSRAIGVDVNNLGPLQLDLLALPVRASWAAGTAIGSAAINLAAIWVAVVVAGRVAGRRGAAVAALSAAIVCWAMGSELLFEPRQHHALLLPFLCLLVLVWALASGWSAALPVAAGVASLLVQTHLTYPLLVALLVAGGVAAWLAGRPPRRDVLRSVTAAAVVAAVCWVQPLVEQVRGDPGNLSAVLDAAAEDRSSAGLAHGARAVADVVVAPPWWAPSGFRSFDPERGLLGAGGAALGYAVLAGLLVAAVVVARRRSDRPAAVAVAASALAVVAGIAAAATQTRGPFGLVAGNYRWLWPLSAFVSAALVLALARGRHAAVAIAAGAAVVVVAALPTRAQVPVTVDDRPSIPVARALLDQLDAVGELGPVAVERTELYFGEPYTYVLLAGLQDRGIDFAVVDDRDVQRFGASRRAGGDEAVLVLRSGDDAVDPPPGEERVAFATTFTAAERAELRRARRAGGDPDLETRWRRETVAVHVRS